MIDINRIYNENCLDTLKRIPDNFINLVITSPPYNMNLRIRNGKYCSRQIVKEFSTKYEGFDDNMPIEEYYAFHLKVLRELLRTSGLIFYNIQIVTGSKRAIFKIIGELSDYLKDIIVWDKGYAQPAMAERVLNRRTELILVFDAKNAISRQFEQVNFNRGTLDDIWQIKRGRKITDTHSAVFPEELVKTIIDNFSSEGDLVYDPFMGTGTTAYVAKALGRNFLGSELTEKYFEIANRRLEVFDDELVF
ncbi:MAG: site-specific DNA-methyltransferase [Capnocytophaga sp.]|jgi:DNA (cytosine-5-)-methyltransferase|nr:MAG: site-specific DNA-methyltransferase [Capnocytophaga sp.]DAN63798.1 MAG TPA: adenine-specific methyltransferase [Caudoviricetes sp.]